MNLLGFIMSLVYMQAVQGWLSAYERLVNSQNFFSPYLTQEDFSRFGRNSIETGYFIERVFPLFHTRFISISDDFDSSKFKGDTGGMDVAFKYLISEYYSCDMSIKTKSAKYAKMQRGEYQSKICPYGYRKSADGRMEPDPEAATVVQLIFQLAAEGISATAITRELFRRSIPTPGQYKAAHGNHTHDISRCHGIWSTSTILRILEDERYTGVYVIGKRAVLEVGGTRSRLKDRESWYIIPDHHPAIIEKAVFESVQASQPAPFFPAQQKESGLPAERQSLLWLLRSCAVPHHAENLVLLLPPFRRGQRKPLPQDASERRRAGTDSVPDAEEADGSRRAAYP